MIDADRRMQLAGGPARREPRAWVRRPHLVCRHCGAVTDVDLGSWPARCAESAVRAGFQVDAAEVTFWGRCARCQSAADHTGAGPSAGPPAVRPLTEAALG